MVHAVKGPQRKINALHLHCSGTKLRLASSELPRPKPKARRTKAAFFTLGRRAASASAVKSELRSGRGHSSIQRGPAGSLRLARGLMQQRQSTTKRQLQMQQLGERQLGDIILVFQGLGMRGPQSQGKEAVTHAWVHSHSLM